MPEVLDYLDALHPLDVAGGLSSPTGGAVFPVSPAQEGMLLHALSGGDAGDYVEQVVLRLREPVESDALIARWNDVLLRHPVFRTSFHFLDGQDPVQVVGLMAMLPIIEEDWSDGDDAQVASRLAKFLETDRATPFDVTVAPLSRLALFRVSEDDFRVVWTVHHLLVDGTSIRLLLQAIFGEDSGTATSPEAPGFPEYVSWLQQQPISASEEFWRRRLARLRERPPFELNTPTPTEGALATHRTVDHALGGELSAALAAFCERENISANIVLLSTWALVLRQYADLDTVVLGITKSVRHCPVVSRDSIGVYINTLPLRCAMNKSVSFRDWAGELKSQWLSMRPHEHCSPRVIQQCSGLDGSRPLFDAHFVFDRAPLWPALCEADARWRHREARLVERTPLPLMLAAYGGDPVTLSLEYDTGRIEERHARRMVVHFAYVLRTAIEAPECGILEIPRMSPEEQAIVLRLGRSTARTFEEQCLHDGFACASTAHPDRVALIAGDTTLTYAELDRLSNQFACQLHQKGILPGDRVGLFMPRSAEAIGALLAILKIGAVYVPVDPAYPPARVEYIVRDASLKAILCSQGGPYPTVLADTIVIPLDRASEGPAHEVAHRDPSAVAYVIYTSGSTGQPKGVRVCHREAAGHIGVMREIYGIEPEDRVLQFASLSFDVSLEQVFMALSAGATLVLANPSECDPATFSAWLRYHQITVADLPPVFLRHWIDWGLQTKEGDFGEQLRLLFVGGEDLPADTVKRWQARGQTRGARLVNAYGPTETVMTATTYDVPTDFGEAGGTRVPIGRPLPGSVAYIVDIDLALLPHGFSGELLLGGARMAQGYHERPELTDARFVTCAWSEDSGARYYRTGDTARFNEEGVIEFLGRRDEQVKIRGFRIELGEIEARIRQLDGIQDVVVRKNMRGDGEHELVAYVVGGSPELDLDALRLALRASLPEYMVPSVFVALASLPLAVSGKVDYQALPAPAAASGVLHVPARNDTEARLISIWREILGVENLGVTDNFFDLGGHSLLAMQMVARVNASFDSSLTLLQVFARPTIAGIGQTLGEGVAVGESASTSTGGQLVTLKSGTGAPFFCIKGAGDVGGSYETLVAALGDHQAFYGFPDVDFAEFEGQATPPSMEAVAARCIQSIREVCPSGPYMVGGYSFGGLVAYEIARQFLEAGESVPLIVIFDSYVPGFDRKFRREAFGRIGGNIHRAKVRLRMMARTWKLLIGYVRDGIRLSLHELMGMRTGEDRPGLRAYLRWIWLDISVQYYLIQAGLVRPSVRERRLEMLEDRVVRHSADRMESSQQIIDEYTLKPIPAEITLLRAAHDPWEMHRFDPTLGWGAYAGKGVRVEVVPGNHMVIIRRPYATSLGRILQRVIDSAV